MATVIDALFVTLGFDPKEFKKGTKEASAAGEKMARDIDDQVKRTKKAETDLGKSRKSQGVDQRKRYDEEKKRNKERETASKQALDAYGKIKGELIGLGAAMLGAAGAKEFISNVIGGNAALYRQSQLLGVSMQQLQKWKIVAGKYGGDGNAVVGSISGIQQAIKREQIYGGSQAHGALASLGLGPEDVNDADVMVRKLRESLKGLSPQEKEIRLANAGLQGLSSIIQLSDEKFAQYVQQAEAAVAKTNALGEAAQDADAAWQGVKDSMQGAADTISVALLPQIKMVTAELDKLSNWTGEHHGEIGEFFKDFGTVVKAIAEGWTQIVALIEDGWRLIAKLDEKLTGGFFGKLITSQASGLKQSATWWKDHILAAGGDKDAQARIDGTAGSRTSGGAIGGRSAPVGGGALASLIGRGEGDYNSVNLGSRGGYGAGTANLGSMTVAQVLAAQQGGQFNAAGRYQIIPSTLKGAMSSMNLSGNEMFDQKMQDKIFSEYLAGSKRKALSDYIHGKVEDTPDSRRSALSAASMEWASIAVPKGSKTESGAISDGTMTYYDRSGKNKASIGEGEMSTALTQERLANMQQMSGASAMAGGSRGAQIETHIGEVNIHTQATDAAGIARDTKAALSKEPLLTFGATVAPG